MADGVGTKRVGLKVVLLFVVGAALRYPGLHTALWLDELISIHSASAISNFAQVFTSIHLDNNHYLNSLYLHAIGPNAAPEAYRCLSFVFGVLSVPAAFWAPGERRLVERWWAGILVAICYLMIHFSSEARGYSGAMLAAILAYGAALRLMDESRGEHRIQWALALLATLTFGILSHLTFFFVLAIIAVWMLAASSPEVRPTALAVLAVVGLLLVMLWWIDVRKLVTLGGTQLSTIPVFARLVAVVLGWPLRDYWSVLVVALPICGLGIYEVMRLQRRSDSRWIVFALGIAVPIFFVLLAKPYFFAIRYLMVFVPIWLMFAACALADMPKPVVAPLFLLFAIGNLVEYGQFLKVGRGNPAAAMTQIGTQTQGEDVFVASDHDFRAGVELDYYQRFLPPGKRLRFLRHDQTASTLPEWVIVHTEGNAAKPPAELTGRGHAWKDVGEYPSSELSGLGWTVFHLER